MWIRGRGVSLGVKSLLSPIASTVGLAPMSTPINYVSPGVIRITDKAGATAELRFTADGSLQQVTDPLGRTSRWMYDANDRAVELIAADNSVTRFSYDAAGI